MRPLPEACRNREGIDPLVLPPGALISTPVELTMVQSANGHREPVADLARHGPLLRKLDVVGIRRGPSTDQTRLRGHKLQVVAVALAHRFADGNDPLSIS